MGCHNGKRLKLGISEGIVEQETMKGMDIAAQARGSSGFFCPDRPPCQFSAFFE
jgi:hypothetical protein